MRLRTPLDPMRFSRSGSSRGKSPLGRRLESRDPLGYRSQAETNEETTSQTTPQSPSERSSAAINSAPGLIRRATLRVERLASSATAVPAPKLTKFRQQMTGNDSERRLAVKHKRYRD